MPARAYNCWLRDWARTAPEAELADFLVPALAELRERENPGAHVSAWVDHQHVQALDKDRQQAVAAALDAGEVELRTAARWSCGRRRGGAADGGADRGCRAGRVD